MAPEPARSIFACRNASCRLRAHQRHSGIPQHGRPFRRCGNVFGPLPPIALSPSVHRSGHPYPAQRITAVNPKPDGPGPGRALLKLARKSRTAHKGRQTCLPLDTPVMPTVLRQRGLAATARAAREDGRLVADQLAAQADQDRGLRSASCPCRHLPVGSGDRQRPYGARHPCSDPSSSSSTLVLLIMIPASAERKRQDMYA